MTVGKSVGVLILFGPRGLGSPGGSRSALLASLVRHTRVSAQFAKVLYRWIMWLLGLVVLIAVLKLARVPLTAFAFLGGALAIGVGFGTQNIIKNLISGMIILFERKLRVGDIVTIGSLSGTVAAVDLRATTVHSTASTSSFLNSNLLENQVSNWTYLNPLICTGEVSSPSPMAPTCRARRGRFYSGAPPCVASWTDPAAAVLVRIRRRRHRAAAAVLDRLPRPNVPGR